MDNYVNKKVSNKALNKLFSDFKENNLCLQTISIMKGDELLLRYAPSPYSCSQKREIYSLSKTFTSTIVGIAYDMGYLSDEDYICDYFPELVVDDSFKKIQIKHVLSMNTGHEECVMNKMSHKGNSYEGFFCVPIKYEPGSHFTYNTGATCLLVSIVERATKRYFMDFANEYLFSKLQINDVYWCTCADGTPQGGTGLHICNDDILKLGKMYLNKGIYNGERILSEEWINKATRFISDNTGNGHLDWCSGYGYQIWLNSNEGYRGDGAHGQLMLVYPERNTIVVIQAMAMNMGLESEIVYDFVCNMLNCDTDELIPLNYTPISCKGEINPFNKYYALTKNPAEFEGVNVNINNDALSLTFSTKHGLYTLKAGNGKFIKSVNNCKYITPCLSWLMFCGMYEDVITYSSFTELENGYLIEIRYDNCPYIEKATLELTESSFKLNLPEDRNTDMHLLCSL